MRALVLRPTYQPYRPYLGQGPAPVDVLKGTLVSVIDHQGRPVVDVKVSAYDNGKEVSSAQTNSHGDALLPVWNGPYDISISYDGHTMWKEASAKQVARGETIIFDLPFCIRDAIIKPIDIGLLLAAGALAGSGVYFKVQPLTVAGEVVFGAAVFSIIYRLSCL